jgi:hypothetical protein
MAEKTTSPDRFLTRREAAQFLTEELGYPTSFSTATKLACLGEFAEPERFWGRRPLYTRSGLRRWTEKRARKAR